MKTPEQALGQLKNNIIQLQELHRTLKPQLEKTTKDLAALGAKPDEPIDQVKLPLDAPTIEQVQKALKDSGKNIKGFQKALGIFDQTELTRKRKALVAAGVTRETENYNGTNQTFVELVVE